MESEPARELKFEIVGEKENAHDRAELEAMLRFVARLMDNIFVIPGTKIRFGLDPIIGLIPGLGDTAGALVSSFLISQSLRFGIPRVVVVRMAANVLLNSMLGAVPVFGDMFSIWFKSNLRNLELLQKHAGARRVSTRGDWLFVGAILLGLFLVIAGAIAGTILFIAWILSVSGLH